MNARPPISDPAFDDGIVPLAGTLLRLLRSDASSGEPLVEVTRMISDLELAFDDLSEPTRGPQFGGEPERLGVLPNPGEDACLLLECQPGRPTWMRLEGDAFEPVFLVGIPPLAYGRRMYAENLGHQGRRLAFLDRKHRLFAEFLQLGGGTSCSHTQLYACPNA